MSLKIALVGSILTLLLHLIVLAVTGQNPLVTPISELSRNQWGALHTVGLSLFGCAHIALAVALAGMDRGRLWPISRVLLVIGGAGMFYLAYYFISASDAVLSSPDADTPLWIVSSLTGIAMGTLQPGLARQTRRLGIFTTVCLGLFLWMVPVLFFIGDNWIGAHERILGSIYIVWMAGVSYGLIRESQRADVSIGT